MLCHSCDISKLTFIAQLLSLTLYNITVLITVLAEVHAAEELRVFLNNCISSKDIVYVQFLCPLGRQGYGHSILLLLLCSQM